MEEVVKITTSLDIVMDVAWEHHSEDPSQWYIFRPNAVIIRDGVLGYNTTIWTLPPGKKKLSLEEGESLLTTQGFLPILEFIKQYMAGEFVATPGSKNSEGMVVPAEHCVRIAGEKFLKMETETQS